jgi:hypothetical protein
MGCEPYKRLYDVGNAVDLELKIHQTQITVAKCDDTNAISNKAFESCIRRREFS